MRAANCDWMLDHCNDDFKAARAAIEWADAGVGAGQRVRRGGQGEEERR